MTTYRITLDELRERLPGVRCRGLCGPEVCHEAPPVYPIERERILEAAGGVFPEAEHGACPFFDGKGCTIYPERPIVCRVYGAEPRSETRKKPWRCPHGCETYGNQDLRESVRAMLDAGVFDCTSENPVLSTNGKINRTVLEAGAVSWHWDGDSLVLLVPDQKEE